MDPIDRAILRQLQRDGRIANNELATLVGLSPSPCLRRVRRLEADGVIAGYSAVVDRAAVGCEYEPIVWVTLAEVTRETMLAFERALDDIPEIVEAARMMGQPDYLLRVVTMDSSTFEGLYIDTLASLPHVQTPHIAARHEGRETDDGTADPRLTAIGKLSPAGSGSTAQARMRVARSRANRWAGEITVGSVVEAGSSSP